ncbi:hypothetical protein SLS64_008658 [Diaporthe eres]|uniref:F-box domain-containing protein n=1 Tax=Diaporthe eres TaxID=83184 RepID=A0ABR1PEB9_DIAER
MATTPQQRHVVLLDDLPPELLREIVDLCADDMTTGRATLLSLSVMNKYIRSVTTSRLFERICFRDGPESPGDEILHSIRRFKAAPEFSWLGGLLKLKYLDITDEQTMDEYHERLKFIMSTLPRQHNCRLNFIKYLARNHALNEDRSELARETFDRCAQLRRICFVRSTVGEVYLRGYPGAVADSTGYISRDIRDADMDEIPKAWHHGVPQTGLLPFPGFTPWEGIDEAPGAE